MRLALVAAIACAAAVHSRAQAFDPKMPASVPPAEGKVVDQATLRYIDVKEGTGAPAGFGKQITVHYTGWLRDGTQFDSSTGRDPLKFIQGRREVIPGFDTGFEGMKVGGKRRLFIPYQLAYGEQQRGKIPPRSELIFDIELIDVKDAPPAVPAGHLLEPLRELSDHVLALAKAIPAEKYAWRPSDGVRSFQEVLIHIANGNRLLLHVANEAPSRDVLMKEIQDNAAREHAAMTKDQVIQLVSDSLSDVRKSLEAERSAAGLDRTIEAFGRPQTRRTVLTGLDDHISEHLGQLIAYARVNGIVPPWSQ